MLEKMHAAKTKKLALETMKSEAQEEARHSEQPKLKQGGIKFQQ